MVGAHSPQNTVSSILSVQELAKSGFRNLHRKQLCQVKCILTQKKIICVHLFPESMVFGIHHEEDRKQESSERLLLSPVYSHERKLHLGLLWGAMNAVRSLCMCVQGWGGSFSFPKILFKHSLNMKGALRSDFILSPKPQN